MGHLGANWLERKSREREEATNLLVNKLPLRIDSIVADIGAGTGYFTFRIAQRVTHGRVIAVDIQDEMLDFIEKRRKTGNITNIKTIKGSVESINIPDQSVDLILLVDAYHEFSHPYEMGVSIAKALKAGGQLVLVEYRAEDPNVPIKRLHKMSERQAVKEITELGLKFESNADYLPRQHVLTFRKR
ncbi:MAG: SAM-dependent methyltransferase [Gammaproteobacteria bacterium]|nr:SAM-dependent methyltransferase [Gammaproteobacteria bacterium]